MATIASLNVALTASSAAFTAGLAKAKTSLASFRASLSSINGTLAAFGTAIAGVGLTAWLKSSADAIDSAGKFAASLGIASEQLGGLMYAADLSGVSTEQLQTALRTMARGVADAALGSGSAAASIQRLGLSASALSAMTPDQQLRALADALREVNNPSERASMAMDLFGRAGVGMLPMLKDGSAGLAAMQAEAERMGVTFSALDFAKIEAANDSLTRVQKIMQGVGQTLAIELAPFIEAASMKLVELGTSGDGVSGKIVGGMQSVASAVAVVADWLSLLKAGFKLAQAVVTTGVYAIIKAIDLIGGAVVKVLNLLPGVQMEWTSFFKDMSDGLLIDVENMVESANGSFKDFMTGASSDRVRNAFRTIRDEANRTAAANLANAQANAAPIEAITKASKSAADRMKELRDQAIKLYEEMKRKGEQVYEATRTPMEKYEKQIGSLGDMLKLGVIDWDTYGRAVRQAREELEQTAKTSGASQQFQVFSKFASVQAAAQPATPSNATGGAAVVALNPKSQVVQEKQLTSLQQIVSGVNRLVNVGGLA